MHARLRLATPADGMACAEIYAPAVAGPTSFELDAPTGDEMAARIASTLPRWPWLVCEVDGRVAGYAYAGSHRTRAAYRWSVEVAVYVREGYQGAGVGRALYESLFAVLALQGFRSAYAGVTMPNDPSVALHTAVGFEPVGVFRNIGFKDGAWHDVAWFARPLAEHVKDPPEPVGVDELDPTALERALSPRVLGSPSGG